MNRLFAKFGSTDPTLVKEQYHPPFLSVGLISIAILAYEILLTRLFSIIHWHHFAQMVISICLLGFGASGSFIAIIRKTAVSRFNLFFITNIVLFAIFSVLGFMMIQLVPFNTFEILWDNQQWANLFLIYLILTVPFFFGANSICAALCTFPKDLAGLYAFNLTGCGLGSITIIFFLWNYFPQDILIAISGTTFLIAAIAALECKLRHCRTLSAVFIACGLLLYALPNNLIPLSPTAYKPLEFTKLIQGTQTLMKIPGPYGIVSVVENRTVPFRQVPGLSLEFNQPIPDQLGVFIDGEGPVVINRFAGDRKQTAYLGGITSALPYSLVTEPHVLVSPTGGGTEILQAWYYRARKIDALEENALLIDLLENTFADYAGWPQLKETTSLYHTSLRAFLASHKTQYDILQLSLYGTSGSTHAGVNAIAEQYNITTEALATLVEHLNPGGYLSVTQWLSIPPRGTLKLVASVKQAMQQLSVANPEQHIALIRGWKTTTLLAKKTALTDEDINQIKRFCFERSFDTVYYPGIKTSDVNRFNQLDRPFFYEGTKALLADQADQYLSSYKFNVVPATDEKPFFTQYFKWSSASEFLALRDQGGITLIETGYPVLVVSLFVAIITSLVLILLPVRFLRASHTQSLGTKQKWKVFAYFTIVGAGFLFIEVVYIHKFILFLEHPIYAFTWVVFSFLVFAGMGSFFTQIFITQSRDSSNKFLVYSITGIVLIAVTESIAFPRLAEYLSNYSSAIKTLATVLWISPIAFFMGIPMPLAMSRLSGTAPQLVPWAWGINGCASVISAILATILAVHIGFNCVIYLAAGLYLCTLICFPD